MLSQLEKKKCILGQSGDTGKRAGAFRAVFSLTYVLGMEKGAKQKYHGRYAHGGVAF
jgi:hypothetical protein